MLRKVGEGISLETGVMFREDANCEFFTGSGTEGTNIMVSIKEDVCRGAGRG